jgi:glucose-1-phosphate thymidylyltransferase
MRKGIILAGGTGSRLFPATLPVCKQLLPVYDKPLIYYPLSVLMLAGIRDILVISTPHDLPLIRRLLGDGGAWGLRFAYAAQEHPAGLADAFRVGRDFIGDDAVTLVLGDNIFVGNHLPELLAEAAAQTEGATVFLSRVGDPQRYGVAEVDGGGTIRAIVEKPAAPKSNWAVTGLYYYDNSVVEIAAALAPSARGELEITDVNNAFIARGTLKSIALGRGYAWMDVGTHDALLQAGNYIAAIENRQDLRIACIEEIAWRMGFIDAEQVAALAQPLIASGYGRYLLSLIAEDGPPGR